MNELLVLIGIVFFPIFTLGCILYYFGFHFLAMIAILISIFKTKDAK